MKIGKKQPKIGFSPDSLFLGYFFRIFIPGPISGPIWSSISGWRPETYFPAGRLDCKSADFGKEFPSQTLWRLPLRNCPSPSCALCPLTCRTKHFLRERKGRKGVVKRGGRGGGSGKGGKKEKRTRENRSERAPQCGRNPVYYLEGPTSKPRHASVFSTHTHTHAPTRKQFPHSTVDECLKAFFSTR